MDDRGSIGQGFYNVPENVQAECALLGALLTNGKKAFPRVEEFLLPEHFYDPLNQEVYRRCLQMYQADVQSDAILVRNQIAGSELLYGRDPAQYVAGLLDAMVGVANAGDYGHAIHDAWLRRQLRTACLDTLEQCGQPCGQSAWQIVEQIEDALLGLSRGQIDAQPNVTVGEAIRQAIASGREAAARGSGLAGLSTGYRAIDRMTGGLMPEAIYLLGARPAMGKTGLGVGIAQRVAAAGHRVLFWSGEMSAKQLGARLGAAWSGVSAQSVFAGRRYDIPEELETGLRRELEPWQWAALEEGERAAENVPLEFDTRGGITIAQLRARARRMKRSKAGLDLIVLDYFGLMRGSVQARGKGRYEETTEISMELKALAKELSVPIIVLAQLNREVEKREDKRPIDSDLRDTGALEQDADLIGFLYREHYYLQKEDAGDGLKRREKETAEQYANRCSEHARRMNETHGRAQLFIRKNRHGPTGTCRLRFDDNSAWFRDESEDERSPAWAVTS